MLVWYIYIHIGFLYCHLIVADYTGVCPVQAPLVTLYLNSAPPRLSAQDARHRLDGRSPPTIERWTKNTKDFKNSKNDRNCQKNVRTMWIYVDIKMYQDYQNDLSVDCRLSTHADSQGRYAALCCIPGGRAPDCSSELAPSYAMPGRNQINIQGSIQSEHKIWYVIIL